MPSTKRKANILRVEFTHGTPVFCTLRVSRPRCLFTTAARDSPNEAFGRHERPDSTRTRLFAAASGDVHDAKVNRAADHCWQLTASSSEARFAANKRRGTMGAEPERWREATKNKAVGHARTNGLALVSSPLVMRGPTVRAYRTRPTVARGTVGSDALKHSVCAGASKRSPNN